MSHYPLPQGDPQLITRTCILCRATLASHPLILPPRWGWLENGEGREPVCGDCLWRASQGVGYGHDPDLQKALDTTNAELTRWKAAEEQRSRQLAACARERDAYAEEAAKVSDLLKDVRLPGENAPRTLERLVTAYQHPPKDGPA